LDAQIAVQAKREARLKPQRSVLTKKPKRRCPVLPRKSQEAAGSIALVRTAPAPECTSGPPADGAGQVGAQAETPTTNRHPRQGGIEHDVKRFATRIRRKYASQLTDDHAARAVKKKACSLLRRNLPPFAGHPKEDSITRAIELRKLGLKWKEVYPEVIPKHALLHPAVRRMTESNLRAAVRSRRNARARRKREGESIAQQTSVVNVPS
jgi:hypothetical protein